MRAGVVPALKQSGEGWETVIIRPGRAPMGALVDILDALDGRRGEGAAGPWSFEEEGHLGARVREAGVDGAVVAAS